LKGRHSLLPVDDFVPRHVTHDGGLVTDTTAPRRR
jgi:hypothetical protein